MRTIAFGLFLVLLLAASLFLLRSIEPVRDAARPVPRVPDGVDPGVSTFDVDRLETAGAEELYSLGVDFQQMWRVREAAIVFEHAVGADSTHHASWLKLIECYAHPLVQDEGALVEAADRALATAPADTSYVHALRRLYVEHDYATAVAVLSALVRGDDAPAEARYHLAVAFYWLGRMGDAARQIEPMVRDDATVGPVVELYVRHAVATGNLDRAADAARELARMYSEEPFPYALIAQVEMARGDHETAVEFCNNALVLDPRCAPAILTRACLYADEGDFEAARVSYEKLMLFDEPILKSIGQEGVAFVDFLAGDFDHAVAAMDEAIREAMMSGSTRRGLGLSSRLVEYLCQLGQVDAAENVVERWITGFGDVPVSLARARIDLVRGDMEAVRVALESLSSDKEWVLWSRVLSIDVTELAALAEIGHQRQREALALLADAQSGTVAVQMGAAARREFLAGFAAFESGNAEAAAASFASVRRGLFGVEFPYHGDPVLSVQSLFFLAESDLARGDPQRARSSYEAFLGYWGESAWELEAVARARRKLEALGGAEAPPQG